VSDAIDHVRAPARRDLPEHSLLTDDLGRPHGGHPQGVDGRDAGGNEQFQLPVLGEARNAIGHAGVGAEAEQHTGPVELSDVAKRPLAVGPQVGEFLAGPVRGEERLVLEIVRAAGGQKLAEQRIVHPRGAVHEDVVAFGKRQRRDHGHVALSTSRSRGMWATA
jgi:hypothetical protein